MTKGNDGKGARRRVTRQLLFAVGCVVIFSVGFFCLSDQQKKKETNSSEGSRGLRDSKGLQKRKGRPGRDRGAADADQEMDPHEREVRYRRYLIDQFESPEEELELLDDVLNGKLHLINIELVEKEMERASEDSYAGVYGSFCELNFAVHKANPSSGTSYASANCIDLTRRKPSDFPYHVCGPVFSSFVFILFLHKQSLCFEILSLSLPGATTRSSWI
jgi:hypothetical protein